MNSLPDTEKQEQRAGKHEPKIVEIKVNGKPVKVPKEVTGAEIKQAAGVPSDFQLFRVQGRKEIPVGNDEELRVHKGEQFLAAPTLDPAYVGNPAHTAAAETVREAFPGREVDVSEPGDGTTIIVVRGIQIGAGWAPPIIDLEVRLQTAFPSSPPYPYYGPTGLARTDGQALAPLQPQVVLDGQQRAQISLNKPFDSTVETLGARLMSVVAWLRDPR
jgi:hypothetical protein